MARLNVIMVKTVRLTAWPLLALMIVYFLTGYALCGQIDLGRLLSAAGALRLHNSLDLPLLALLLAHSLAGTYLAFRRWGWIGRRRKI